MDMNWKIKWNSGCAEQRVSSYLFALQLIFETALLVGILIFVWEGRTHKANILSVILNEVPQLTFTLRNYIYHY